MSDNFHFDLTGVSLAKALDIAFGQTRKAVGWREDPIMSHSSGVIDVGQHSWVNKDILALTNEQRLELSRLRLLDYRAVDREGNYVHPTPTKRKRLILFWTKHESMTPLPAPMSAEDAVSFVKAWLAATDYGSEPDHDGDNGKGFRIYNEAWTHVAGLWEAFVAIEPVWMMYGK